MVFFRKCTTDSLPHVHMYTSGTDNQYLSVERFTTGRDAVGYESSERDNNSRPTHNTHNTMKIEKATRYDFENQSSVTIHRTAVNASMGDEQVTLNTLNEHDLLLAVCSYIDCIKYRNSDEMPKYFEPLERSVAKLREFIEDEKHKANA